LYRVFGVLVEVGVEDALILEVQAGTDVEEHPPQVVQAERRQGLRTRGDGFLNGLAVRADRVLAALLHLGDDGEPVAGRRPGVCRSVPPALELEVPSLGIAIAAGLVQSLVLITAPLLDAYWPKRNTEVVGLKRFC